MLDLMDEPQEVKDVPNAAPIHIDEGKIEFKKVSFYYQPERAILKDISFVANPGETIAFVSKLVCNKLLHKFKTCSNLISHLNFE